MQKNPLFVEYTGLVNIHYSWNKASFSISKSYADDVVRLHMLIHDFLASLLLSPSCVVSRNPGIIHF